MTDPHGPARASREDSEALLDERSDPGGAAFGALGAEAYSDLNWWRMLHHRVQRRALGSSRHQWWVLWVLLGGLLALNFTFTVFNIVLTKVAAQFHTGLTVLTWTSVGPTLAYGLAAPVFGRIGDVFGHRRLYLFGLIGGMVSAIATALAPSVMLLILARTLDGIQGAATGTASGALLNLVFSREERVKAAGWWSLVGAGGPVIGLSLGAPIIQFWGWRSLFWVQLGLLVTAFFVVLVVLPHTRHSEEMELERQERARRNFRQMDWLGSWSLSASVVALMLALTFGTTQGWASPLVIACFVATVVFGYGFVHRIRHADNPLIPPHYFSKRNFVFPLVSRGLANYAYFAGFWMTPLLLERCYAASTTEAGFYSAFRPVAFALCSPLAGYAAIKVGERTTAVVGAALLAASMGAFWFLNPAAGIALVLVALALSGLGQGIAGPASGATMANQVDPSEFGVMSAAQLLSMQIGQVLGIQVSISLQAAMLAHYRLNQADLVAWPISTFRPAFFVGAIVAVAALVCNSFIRSLPRDGSGRQRAEAFDDAH